jgi:hypothetical protein
MNLYQWTVLLAAWLGWGFDIFDGLLFNYVAPNCVPTLLGLPISSPSAKAATLLDWSVDFNPPAWVGSWGIIFGKLADRIGRSKPCCSLWPSMPLELPFAPLLPIFGP